MKLNEHIFLIGFMGCGKTTNAGLLSKMTGAEQMEMDQEIVKSQGMAITEIFAKFGEPYFRNLETELLRSMKGREPMIVSCGGGAVLREENVALMKETGKIVLLTAAPESIYDRVKDSSDRPILNGNMNMEYISGLMEKRRPGYEAAADFAVSTDRRSTGEICEEILMKMGGNEMNIKEKFDRLGIDNAPGQEALQKSQTLELRGEPIPGPSVDFSHGDVDAHKPAPGSFEVFAKGVEEGAAQAYTPYRGRKSVLEHVAKHLSAFTGAEIDPAGNVIITPGTQGALFLAMGANMVPGDKVAIMEPDYFANRKMVEFFHGELVPVRMDYKNVEKGSGIDLEALEKAFADGVKLFLFSNPNNPVGCVYTYDEITAIAALAKKYNVTLIVDELYTRQVYPGVEYTHLCAQKEIPDNLITIIGPSKTESLSGYRLGAAFGTAEIIERMEKLQAIMALRCSGYNQAVLFTWFEEPEGWLADRVRQHMEIRDAILEKLNAVPGVSARPTEGGSYLFVEIPELDVTLHQFIRIVRELANVTVTPGTEFGPQFLHHFRINFSQDKEKAAAAIERLLAVMERYRKQ